MYRARLLLTSLIVAASAALVACNDATSPERERSELDTNREKWQARGLGTYTVTMTRLCFCGEVGPFGLTVIADSVVMVTRKSDGKTVDARYLPTVTKLFDFIERAIADHAAVIRVTYDAQLGYPREIVYDLSTSIADEEVTYTLSDLEFFGIVNDRR